MSFFKKALLMGGVPVRPTTKKNRYAKKSLKELKAQTIALQRIANAQQPPKEPT